MKSHLRIRDHHVNPGEEMVEIWRGDKFVGAIYGTETGVKIVSKDFVSAAQLVTDAYNSPGIIRVDLEK
jgi:hypothetical protein